MPLRSLPLPPLPLKKKLGAKIGIPQSFVCSSNEKPTWIPRRVSFQRIPGRVLRRGGTTQPSTSTQIYVECFLDWLGELGHLLLLVRWRRYSKNLTKAITEFLHSATRELLQTEVNPIFVVNDLKLRENHFRVEHYSL